MSTASITAGVVSGLLLKRRVCATSEEELQRAIEGMLAEQSIPSERERRLGPRDRVDFLTHDGLAIEIKVDGAAVNVARQLLRYALCKDVRAILLVTTSRRHAALGDEPSIGGKPFHYLSLLAGAAL